MFALIVFIAAVLAFTAGLAWVAYLLLRGRMHHAGPVVGFVWLLVVAGLFPIPIHGGFMFTYELWIETVDEWLKARSLREERRREEAFLAEPAAQLPAPLPVVVMDGTARWARVQVAGAGVGHLHRPSGLVFTDPFPWSPTGQVDWEQADSRCRELDPSGTWALPTQGELFLFWRDGGAAVSPWGQGRFVSVLIDGDLQMRMTVRHLGQGPELLRCVARTARAPVERVTRAAIETADWNRYQLDPGRYR